MYFLKNFFKNLFSSKKAIFVVILILLFFSFLYVLVYAAGTPKILSYQGRLSNASGNLLGGSGTTYYFKFSIWDDATVDSGTRLWPSSAPTAVAATVRQGVFNVNIGDTANGYPNALDYDFDTDQDIYLQVEVSSTSGSGFETVSPRQRITSSAFARLSAALTFDNGFQFKQIDAGTVIMYDSTGAAILEFDEEQ